MLTIQSLYEAAGGSTVVTVGLIWLEKKFGWIKPIMQYAEDHKGLVKEAEGAAVAGLGELLHSPKVAELELKAERLESQLHDNQLVQLAGQVLHASGKRLDSMTAEQKTGIGLVVSTEAKKLGLSVTPAAVSNALTVADKAIDAIGSLPLFQAATQIDAQPVQQETNSPASDGQAAVTTA